MAMLTRTIIIQALVFLPVSQSATTFMGTDDQWKLHLRTGRPKSQIGFTMCKSAVNTFYGSLDPMLVIRTGYGMLGAMNRSPDDINTPAHRHVALRPSTRGEDKYTHLFYPQTFEALSKIFRLEHGYCVLISLVPLSGF